jgi:hypothetical protein
MVMKIQMMIPVQHLTTIRKNIEASIAANAAPSSTIQP